MVGKLDRGWEGKGVGDCVLTADCVRGIGESVGWEGIGGIVLTADYFRGIG